MLYAALRMENVLMKKKAMTLTVADP